MEKIFGTIQFVVAVVCLVCLLALVVMSAFVWRSTSSVVAYSLMCLPMWVAVRITWKEWRTEA